MIEYLRDSQGKIILATYLGKPVFMDDALTYAPGQYLSLFFGQGAFGYTGVYQISIVSPAGQAQATTEGVIDELSNVFSADSELTRNGFEGMVVEPVEQGPTIHEPATYTVPASFTYRGIADQPPAGA